LATKNLLHLSKKQKSKNFSLLQEQRDENYSNFVRNWRKIT
jgi:hypothetical protein